MDEQTEIVATHQYINKKARILHVRFRLYTDQLIKSTKNNVCNSSAYDLAYILHVFLYFFAKVIEKL